MLMSESDFYHARDRLLRIADRLEHLTARDAPGRPTVARSICHCAP